MRLRKAYYITDWIGYIAEWLSAWLSPRWQDVRCGRGRHVLLHDHGGRDKVTSEEFIPDATYVDEFYACEESEDT